MRREGRSEDDGYRSALLPGLRASADAARLAEEIAFAAGRLTALRESPPGLYGQARALSESDPEQANWICFLTSYLCPAGGRGPVRGRPPGPGRRAAARSRGRAARPAQLP